MPFILQLLLGVTVYVKDIDILYIYKRVDLYLWTELAPVLEGSGSRRRHPQKGTSVDRVSVVFAPSVDRQYFYSSSKTDSWWEHVR